MTAEQLAALAGVILSLAVSYVPGVNTWYGNLDSTGKRIIMGLLILVVAAGALGLSCANIIQQVACTTIGLWSLVNAVIAALVANQATYLLTPKPATADTRPLGKG